MDPTVVFQCGKDKMLEHFLRRPEDQDGSNECTSWTIVGVVEYYFPLPMRIDVYSTLAILFQVLPWHRGGSELSWGGPPWAPFQVQNPWICFRYWDGLGRAASICIQSSGCFHCDELSEKDAVNLKETYICFTLTANIYHSVNMSKRISTKFMSENILTIPILVLNRKKVLCSWGVWFIWVTEVSCLFWSLQP